MSPAEPIDEILRDATADGWSHGWRYFCYRRRCGYYTIPLTRRGAELRQRVHRHRHLMGLAGSYHRPQTIDPE